MSNQSELDQDFSVGNRRILLFTMGNWSHTNGALVKALHDRLPQWDINVVDLLQQFRQDKRALLSSMIDVPVLAGQALLDRGFDRNNILYAPATSRFINRLAQQHIREYEPAFTLQTTTRFNACGGEVPHFTVIDMTVAAARQSYRDLFHSTERALDQLDDFQREVFAGSSGVFAMGHYVRDSLVSHYDVEPHRAHTIGAGPNIVMGARSPLIGSQSILFVGTDWIRKGGPTLLKAFRKVKAKNPHAKLNIIGCSPNIDEPGVHIIGRVRREQLHNYFTDARVFALPTVHEAFGVAFVEALHFGLPIVATPVGAVTEMVKNGVNGHIVQPGDVYGLARALDELLTNDEIAAGFGAASYTHAQNFTWERAAEILHKNIFELIRRDDFSVDLALMNSHSPSTLDRNKPALQQAPRPNA